MADAEVIHLPTAAARAVRQPASKATLADALDRHPAAFVAPDERERRARLDRVAGSPSEALQDSAGLLIAAYLLVFAEPQVVAGLYRLVLEYDELHRTAETAKAARILASIYAGHHPKPEPQP